MTEQVLESDGDGPEGGSESPPVRGPHLWLNWKAHEVGQPARTSHSAGIRIVPLWEEMGLYSDSRLVGELVMQPYELFLAFSARAPELGRCELSLVLRSTDHLLDGSAEEMDLEDQQTIGFAGGNLGQQMASLLSLALGRRMRSGGTMRMGYEQDPKGAPRFFDHHAPDLAPPHWRRPILPSVADEARLEDAEPFLRAFSKAGPAEAVAVMRAAHQYADALWFADAAPRISWIKLFGALEAAANQWDLVENPDSVDQLRRRHPSLVRDLERTSPDAIPIVARRLSRVLGAERKMIDFVIANQPGPREPRPAFGELDLARLPTSLSVLYDHRSLEIHAGIPFPDPLCEPPVLDDKGVPVDVYPALGVSGGGGSWPAHRLPMYLHSFVYVVGEALRKWCLGLA